MATVMLLGIPLSSAPAAAQTRPPPAATQHALDELANAIAQGKITRTPTPTPSAIATLLLTATPIPTAVSAPPTPATPEPATPPPVPLVSNVDQTVSGYVRPSPGDPSGTWVELALPDGRWTILYEATLCTPPAVWTNVWLAQNDRSDRPETIERDDVSAMCTVAQWSRTSDVPCAADDQGTCDVELDVDYVTAFDQLEPTATAVPVATTAPAPQLTATPRPPVVRAAAPTAILRPEAPTVASVVQTVIVVVTVVPTVTRTSTQTSVLTSTPAPTRTATPSPPPPTVEATSTQTPFVAAASLATQPPALVAASDSTPPEQTPWNWPLTFLMAAVVMGLIAIWLFVARSGPLMW